MVEVSGIFPWNSGTWGHAAFLVSAVVRSGQCHLYFISRALRRGG